ncbi:MAG: UbiD family decarboxylase [Candidatus Caldarchaeum sp.]
MPKDLRTFLNILEKETPEEIVYVKREVSPKFEAPAVVAKLETMGKFPAVMFEKVKGSQYRLLMNMHASVKRMCRALEIPFENVTAAYRELEEKRVKPKRVSDGPVKEVILKGDKVDLNVLPITTLHELDAGAYVDGGLLLSRDPELGHYNLGVFRHMVQKKDQLGVQFSETAQTHYIHKKYERKNEKMEVAICIGHHPAFNIGGVANTSPGVDQYEVCGALMREPVELVKCETVDLEVPANCEVVIEGYIPPGVMEYEAPYGEYPGTYGRRRLNPIIKVTAITMRHDAIYQNGFSGHRDNLVWGMFNRLNIIYRFVKHAVPSVTDINMPLSGRCRYICYVKTKKTVEGEAKNAVFAAFAADPFLKYVIVVDDDVNIHNDVEVMHAIATRVRADEDIFIVPNAKGSPLDPTVREPAMVAKMGIDATRKPYHPEEIRVPGVEQLRIEDYLEKTVLEKVPAASSFFTFI